MNEPYPVFGIAGGEVLAGYLVFGGAALATLFYCIRIARRERVFWPVAVFGGSALLVTYEPFNNFLAKCAYPTGAHQDEMLTYLGQHVPWMTWLIYMFYFAFAVPLLVQRLDRGMTLRSFARFCACVTLACAAFEPLFCNINSGLRWWYYYGPNQAFNITGLPMWWWFANSMVVVVMGVIVHLLKQHVLISNAQQLLLLPLLPLILFAVHGSAAAPVFITMRTTESELASALSSLATIAISGLYLWLFGKAACGKPGSQAPATRAEGYTAPLACSVTS